LLFASHPVQTEAVTYIFQRLASLVSLFYLLSIVLYIQSRISERAGPKYVCYGLSLVSCLIAMKTKENAFTLPFTIALLEILFCQGPLKKRLLFLIPFLLTSLIIPLTIIGIGKPLNEMITRMNPSVFGYRKIEKWEYLYTQFRVVVTYLRLLVFPVSQNFSYDYPVYQTFLRPEVIASFIFLSLLFLLAIYLIYRSRRGEPIFRLIGFGILWFFMTLSIESGIIPIAMVINEYRLYLPSVGSFIAVASGASLFVRRLDSKQAESVFRWFALLIIFIFSLATYSRNMIWGDGVRLWEDTVSKSPRKCQPLINLGWAYEQKGQIEETIRTYEAALRLCPGRSELYTSLGSLYARQNRFEEAVSSLERAVRLNPDFGLTYIILGTVYGKMEKLDGAISAFQKALRLQFDAAETHHKLGLIYEKQKRPDEAIQSFREAIALAPADPEPHYHLGLGYMRKGRYEEAVRAFQDAIRRRPNFVDAHNDLGVVFAIQGKFEAAMDQFRLVLRIQPQNSMARANFAKAQNEMRRRTEESSRK